MLKEYTTEDLKGGAVQQKKLNLKAYENKEGIIKEASGLSWFTLRNQCSCIYKRLDHAILKYSKQLGTKSCSREVFDGLKAIFCCCCCCCKHIKGNESSYCCLSNKLKGNQ